MVTGEEQSTTFLWLFLFLCPQNRTLRHLRERRLIYWIMHMDIITSWGLLLSCNYALNQASSEPRGSLITPWLILGQASVHGRCWERTLCDLSLRCCWDIQFAITHVYDHMVGTLWKERRKRVPLLLRDSSSAEQLHGANANARIKTLEQVLQISSVFPFPSLFLSYCAWWLETIQGHLIKP